MAESTFELLLLDSTKDDARHESLLSHTTDIYYCIEATIFNITFVTFSNITTLLKDGVEINMLYNM